MQPRGASKKAFLIVIGKRAILAATAALVLSAQASAQIDTGSIVGTVRDASGLGWVPLASEAKRSRPVLGAARHGPMWEGRTWPPNPR